MHGRETTAERKQHCGVVGRHVIGWIVYSPTTFERLKVASFLISTLAIAIDSTSSCSSNRLRVEHLPPAFARYLILLQHLDGI